MLLLPARRQNKHRGSLRPNLSLAQGTEEATHTMMGRPGREEVEEMDAEPRGPGSPVAVWYGTPWALQRVAMLTPETIQPHPRTWEGDLIWEKGLCRYN